MDFAILPSCSNLSDVLSRCIASHRVNAPVFLRMASQRSGSYSPIPPPVPTTTTVRRPAPPVGRRARGTWTTTLGFVQKTLHVGATLLATQDGLNEYARDKKPGLLVPHSAGCNATLQRSRSRSLNSQTCSLRATPACCKICQHSSASIQR